MLKWEQILEKSGNFVSPKMWNHVYYEYKTTVIDIFYLPIEQVVIFIRPV